MGYRNIIGWRHNGEVVGSYSQWGGYVDGIPLTIQAELREFRDKIAPAPIWPALIQLIEQMRLVKAEDKVPEEDRVKFADSLNPGVSTGKDWYAQLRNHQGSLMKRLNAGIMTDDSGFEQQSLFCEYAVIIDVDAREVVLLCGFNTDPEKEWGPIKIDPEKWKPSYEGEKLEYYACSLHWKGDMEEFLSLDIVGTLVAKDGDEDAA